MAKYQGKRMSGKRTASRRRRRRGSTGLIIAVLLVLALVIGGVIWFLSRNPKSDAERGDLPEEVPTADTYEPNASSGQEEEQAGAEPEEAPAGLAFPYTVGDSGLEVNSLLSSDIFNPDAGNEMVEQLASLELTNISGRYLVSAQIRVTLTDGTAYLFQVQDLPAGGKTIAFAVDNAVYDDTTPCDTITAETEFADGSQRMEESISVSVDGATVTLLNLTGEDLGPLTVVCRDTLDETEFFGGVSYSYRTETIPAGGSAAVEASDCIIGQPAVVRITPDN